MNWFYSPDGTQRHEVSDEALAGLVRDGRLTGDMLLWRDGMSDWRPARVVRPDLFGGGGGMSGGRDEVPPPPPPPLLETTPGSPAAPSQVPPPAAPGIPYHQPMPIRRASDSGALTSLISGIIGLVGATSGFCCCFGFLVAPIAGLVAVIFGHQVYSKSQGHPEAESDRTMALAGLILGYLSLLLTVGGFIWNLVFVGIAGMGAALEGIKSGAFSP